MKQQRNMNIQQAYHFLLICLMCVSCTQVIDVPIPPDDNNIVIEARVTNLDDYYSVLITKTRPLDDNSQLYTDFTVIRNAIVIISDNLGTIDTLPILPNDTKYKTKTKKKGVPGVLYTLRIELNGKEYIAQDQMMNTPILDSLYAEYLTAYSAIGVNYDGYYLFCDFKDPANINNYYRYDIQEGCCPIDLKQQGVFDDRFLAPQVKGFRLLGYYYPGYTYKINFYSMSKAGYDYYNGLSLDLTNDGGFFSTPPVNPPTNISGGALGFFLVASAVSDSLTIP